MAEADPLNPIRDVEYVLNWIRDEAQYTVDKFGVDEDDGHTAEFISGLQSEFGHAYWIDQINSYLYRAKILGITSPGGRQALAKAASTVVGFTASVARTCGDFPEPGVPSGNNLKNLRERGAYGSR